MISNKIKIIYEDNHLLVIEKPINMPTQADVTGDPDLLTLLKDDIKLRYNKQGNVYLGLVHRLDRPVGGVMVFAKTSKGASRLSEQIRVREFNKVYLAIVHGTLESTSGFLEHYLLKDSKSNIVSVVDKSVQGAKDAKLNYEVIANISCQLSLIRISLLTGRSHQIRVQFSVIGHPLYGDQKYGVEINKPGQQIALWSSELVFKHPTKNEEMKFESLPDHVYPWSLFDLRKIKK